MENVCTELEIACGGGICPHGMVNGILALPNAKVLFFLVFWVLDFVLLSIATNLLVGYPTLPSDPDVRCSTIDNRKATTRAPLPLLNRAYNALKLL